MKPLPLRNGQLVKVATFDRTVEGMVLASGNGEPPALNFESVLSGYVGMMPVL